MGCESLANLIGPFVDGPFDAMLDGLRQRVECVYLLTWDGLPSDQRLAVAQQHDVQHDPAMTAEFVSWDDSILEASHWCAINVVTPIQAAMLLWRRIISQEGL